MNMRDMDSFEVSGHIKHI